MSTSATATQSVQKGTHKTHSSYSKAKTVRDTLRFQFVFGGAPEDHITGKNITGNMTVTYVVPYDPDHFTLGTLKSHVEAEHDNNIRLAQRLTNQAKKNEHLQIAKFSIESVRAWFNSQKLDVDEFMEAVKTSYLNNFTTHVECTGIGEPCRLLITPQFHDGLI